MDIHSKSKIRSVSLQVARWGNSLAVRIPADYARRARVRDGDTLLFIEADDGSLALKREPSFDRAAFVERLRKETATIRTSPPIVEAMRRKARY